MTALSSEALGRAGTGAPAGGPTERLARLAAEASWERLPEPARMQVKLGILDCLGVAAAAGEERVSRIIRGWVAGQGSTGVSTIWFTDGRAAPALAALANGTVAHALDYDDVGVRMLGHPSAAMVPALLALGEARGASGREVLAAYTAGLEVAERLGALVNPAHAGRGWNTTGTLGSLAAAAGSARLLGLPADGVEEALGLATTLAGGVRAANGTMAKPLFAGMAAWRGVAAAELVAAGFTGPRGVVEGRFGLVEMFGGPGQRQPADGAAEDVLASGRALERSGLGIKLHASCACSHPVLDALLALRREAGLSPDDVEEISVVGTPMYRDMLVFDTAASGYQGKFSLAYAAAVALLDGVAGVEQFTDERAKDPEVRRLSRLVRLAVDSALEARGPFAAIVTVRTRDGRRFELRADEARGTPARPLAPDDVVEKFRRCTAGRLEPARAEEVVRLVLDLESLSDVRRLAQRLVMAAGGTSRLLRTAEGRTPR